MTPNEQEKADARDQAKKEEKAAVDRKAAEKKAPLDTATTDRSPGKQGKYGENPK